MGSRLELRAVLNEDTEIPQFLGNDCAVNASTLVVVVEEILASYWLLAGGIPLNVFHDK
jgi:hypothetical protein